jgi:hypothetical protein
VPKGITKVFRSETDFIGTLSRTQLNGPADIPDLQKLQAQITLTPLSRFAGTSTPAPAPAVTWPVWDAKKAEGIGFIGYLNALLPFMPTVPSERAMMARFAQIGIGPGVPFDPAKLDPALRTAMEEGVAKAAKDLSMRSGVGSPAAGLHADRASLSDQDAVLPVGEFRAPAAAMASLRRGDERSRPAQGISRHHGPVAAGWW